MGVPKFYRFISERYPLINTPLIPENAPTIDNLYLDMNGIIHNCVHSTPGNGGIDTKRYLSDLPSPAKSSAQIYLDVFKYIDNIFSSIRPRRLLYMAIDGVAPRAKMNQQRSRRFRAAQERHLEHQKNLRQNPMYAASEYEPFDSNCITPGTSFMQGLTNALHYFIAKKITEDSRWSKVQIILSGAEAPGEGEHKIMEYIRCMRESGNLQPNTRHCVYGLDADLIMLGLITHEPHFFILREKVNFNFWKKKSNIRVATQLDINVFGEFELLSIGLLREYLALDLGAGINSQLSFFDLERITDDFVFILMLIGNDFLPNLPTLDIADGTLHVLLHVYKRLLPVMNGYLTHSGKIHPERLEFFFAKLAMVEEHILLQKKEERDNQGLDGKRSQAKPLANVNLDEFFQLGDGTKPLSYQTNSPKKLFEMTRATQNRTKNKETLKELRNEYYVSKFGKEFLSKPTKMTDLVKNYIEGISWTLKYYTEGCRQWRWFYPFHYAPLASDIMNISHLLLSYESNIKRDNPFQPLEQLLSVLPPKSAWCLPPPYRSLMTSSASPIRDQYPEEFEIDMNGKRNDWEAVVLLPFVDEKRLVTAIRSISMNNLTKDEIQRGRLGISYMYTHSQTVQSTANSPFGAALPPVSSQAKTVKLILPTLKEGTPFRARLLRGTKEPFSTSELEDLPTLKSMKHSGSLAAIGVNVFGMSSRSESLCLKMKSDDGSYTVKRKETFMAVSQDVISLEKRGIIPGSRVWYGYPWRKSGTVFSVCDERLTRDLSLSQTKSKSTQHVTRIDERKTRKLHFVEEVNALVSRWEQKCAVTLASPTCIVKIKSDENGEEREEHEKNSLELVYERFILGRQEKGKSAVTELSPLHTGQVVLYTGKGTYFGHKCRVIAVGPRDNVKVSFDRCPAAAREPPFGYQIVEKSRQREWLTLPRLAKAVQINPFVADACLGSVRVRISSKDEVDIGLGIKYIGRSLYIPGYAKPDSRYNFVFSEDAVKLLKQYKSSFPNLFMNLERHIMELKSREDQPRGQIIFTLEGLFGNTKQAEEAARAAATWISVQDVASQPLLSTSSIVLSKDTISELEKNIHISDRLQTEYEKAMNILPTDKHIKTVSRDVLLDASTSVESSRTPSDEVSTKVYPPVPKDGTGLRVGDRVVNRIGVGSVPFALRGSVVGFHVKSHREKNGNKESNGYDNELSKSNEKEVLVEVVFDEGFFGGGSLNGRCSKNRGKVVPADSLYIIRPDRDNQYYSNHYSRIAGIFNHVGRVMDNRTDRIENRKKKIENAAVQSYADALKKQPVEVIKTNASRKNEQTGIRRGDRYAKQIFGYNRNGEAAESKKSKVMDKRVLPVPSFVMTKPTARKMGQPEINRDRKVETLTESTKKVEESKDRTTEADKLAARLRLALGIGKSEVDSKTKADSKNGFALEDGSRSKVERKLDNVMEDDDEFVFQWHTIQQEELED